MPNFFVHTSADVQTQLIGVGSKIWQHVIILPSAKIGKDVNICAQCFIENDVTIGDRVTIKSGVYLWDGVKVEDDVFIGPNVTFTNDKLPRSKHYPENFLSTIVEKGASIGAGAVILPGVTIGRRAMVGAGALVTKSVPPFAIVTGSPAKITGYVDCDSLIFDDEKSATTDDLISEGIRKIGVGDSTLHHLKLVHDIRGNLSVGEFPSDIPFVPKRYFLVFDVPSEKTRGEHAHHECHQFLICVKGCCSVVLDDGSSRREVLLNAPHIGIHIPPLIWGIQYKYSKDAVLLVFTSDRYKEEDYIREYSVFKSLKSI